jgi:hypothetical protein
LTFEPILRRADKHFDQIIVQTIVELALKAPFELRVVQIARMQVEVISVHRNGRILELDDELHAIALGASREIQQWMLVESQLSQDAFQAWIAAFGHKCIVKATENNPPTRTN